MDITTIIKYEDDPIAIKLCRCSFEDSVSVANPKEDYTIFVKSEPFHTVMFTFDILEDARDLFFKMMKADIG
jgi:hypothetical protein